MTRRPGTTLRIEALPGESRPYGAKVFRLHVQRVRVHDIHPVTEPRSVASSAPHRFWGQIGAGNILKSCR
jgi:hypothetical protein